MLNQRLHLGHSATRAALVAAACLAWPAPDAQASPQAAVINAQVSIASYQTFLETQLYTHLGDNRGNGPQHDLARANIVAALTADGLNVTLESFTYLGNTYYNVVAQQTGTVTPSQIVVVGAHFDSVNNPGADDNATGTALVVEMARVLSKHRSPKTIRFITFDREEQGRRGSIAYVAAHAGETIQMAVTADMVGHDSGSYGMDLYSKSTSSTITNGVATAIDTYGSGLHRFLNIGNYSFSDHWSFESAGIPAVVIIERNYQLNTNYHQSTDAVDIAPGYLAYPMVADLLRSVCGYLVDTIGIQLWGDGDSDADVDAADLAAFRACFGSPGSGSCVGFDINRDGTVNCLDWPLFKSAYLASSGVNPRLDIPTFVSVLIGLDTSPADLCLADMDGSGTLNGGDVQAYLSTP